MKPHTLTVTRTARWFQQGPEGAAVRELVLGLHGHAQLAARFLKLLDPLDDGHTLLAAPEALSRFYLETRLDGRHGHAIGATWLTREHRTADLADHLAWLEHLRDHLLAGIPHPPVVTLLGFSQGAAMAARWVASGRAQAGRVVLWGIPLPHDLPLAEFVAGLGGAPVVLAAGDADAYCPAGALEADADRLREAGADVRVRRFPGGHTLPPAALRAALGRPGEGTGAA